MRELSGGEKTSASLSIIFSSYAFRRCPLCVLDEVDAALDAKNSLVLGRFLALGVQDLQILCISLRSSLYSCSPKFIITYKLSNNSRSVVITNIYKDEAEKLH